MSEAHENERFDAEAIGAGLGTERLGRQVVYYPVIGSTNDEAKLLAGQGAPEGLLVIANEQTAGRGRLRRRWLAPAGGGLLFTLILRPALPPAQVSRVTMACGLAAADAVWEVAGVKAGLKWPNDLLVGDRKLAGILTELALNGEALDYLAVGIGINVTMQPAGVGAAAGEQDLAQDPSLVELGSQATSLSLEAGRPISRLRVLWRFLENLERRYAAVLAGQSPYQEWTQRLVILDRAVCVDLGSEQVSGTIEGVDADGALLLREAQGGLRRVLAGDVSLRRPGAKPETS